MEDKTLVASVESFQLGNMIRITLSFIEVYLALCILILIHNLLISLLQNMHATHKMLPSMHIFVYETSS